MKNPFANLFKKKNKNEAASTPAPKPEAGKKKEGFFSKLLKNRLGKSSIKGEEILGEKVFSKIGLKSTQIYLSSENLISWTNLGIYKNTFDPEFDPGTQATRRYPITRSYTVGLRILF